MAVVQIPNLPLASGLTGTEQLEIVQAGVSCRTTTQDVANLAVPLVYFAGYYGSFCNTTSQTNAGATSANVVTYNVTTASSGVTLALGSRLTTTYAGVYNLQFSIQASKSDDGNDDIDIWIAKNGSNISNTNSRSTLVSANDNTVITRNYVTTMAVSDYLELYWSSADTLLSLTAAAGSASPTRPAIPSVVATMTLVQGI
jgi:hypothetical protein